MTALGGVRTTAVLAAIIVAGGCADDGARPIRLDMAGRSSCTSNASNQDVSCVKSLEIRMVDADRNLLYSQCTPVTAATIDELWRASGFTRVLTEVKAKKNVYVEMRAYQARDRQPCDNLRRSDLILWGSSALVDLSDATTEVVSITYECRPDCMCDALGSSECPFELQEEALVCAPAAKVPCSAARICDAQDECLGGELVCSSGRCRAIEANFCAACTTDANCVSGPCVLNRYACESFCAIPCPGPAAIQCPDDTSCKRLGSANFELYEDPPQACP